MTYRIYRAAPSGWWLVNDTTGTVINRFKSKRGAVYCGRLLAGPCGKVIVER